ncbi:MAG: tetratricopeptide repeat protein, partial [Planctomycetota bacterium]
MRQRISGSRDAVETTEKLQDVLEASLAAQQSGQLEIAKQHACQALEIDGFNADAWNLLGTTLLMSRELNAALECLSKACELINGHAELHNNLGVVLLELGQIKMAARQFQTSLGLQPEAPNALMNLANCLLRENRLHDAEAIYRELLESHPNDANTLANLGEVLRRQCRWKEAIECLERSADANSKDLIPRVSLGRTQANAGQLDAALNTFQGLAERVPQDSKVRHYLGKTLFDLGRWNEAVEELQRAHALDPTDAHILCTLGFLQLELDQREKATECFRRAIQQDPHLSEAHGCLLYLMSGDPDVHPQQLFDEHVLWGRRYSASQPISHHENSRSPDRKLRIGYVSADFRQHAAAGFFEPLLRLRDAETFEVYCYHEFALADDVTEQLKALSDHWRYTHGYSDQQVVRQILEDKIDILVDLSGHTWGSRLTAFSYKPAPIQISWLGYPNTTGVPAIDYCLTCEVQNPSTESLDYHTEELIRLPSGSFSFSPPNNAPELTPLPALERGYVTFGSLHRPFKISRTTHDLWAETLLACPDSKLIAF